MDEFSNNKKTYIKRKNISGVDVKKANKSKLISCRIKQLDKSKKTEVVDSNWYSYLKNY